MFSRLFFFLTLLHFALSPLQADEPATPPPYIQSPQEEEGISRFFEEFINMLFALGAIVCALLLVGWALKKMLHTRVLQANESSAIKILERRSLSPKTAIYLIEVQGKAIVIGESPTGLAPLGEVSPPVATSFDRIMEEQKSKSES